MTNNGLNSILTLSFLVLLAGCIHGGRMGLCGTVEPEGEQEVRVQVGLVEPGCSRTCESGVEMLPGDYFGMSLNGQKVLLFVASQPTRAVEVQLLGNNPAVLVLETNSVQTTFVSEETALVPSIRGHGQNTISMFASPSMNSELVF